MPKRGKQRPRDPEESGDEESGSSAGPPSLLGPPPIANGKIGGPDPGFHRGSKGLREPEIPPLLSLPLPFWGGCPMRGGPGPRPRPYQHSRGAMKTQNLGGEQVMGTMPEMVLPMDGETLEGAIVTIHLRTSPGLRTPLNSKMESKKVIEQINLTVQSADTSQRATAVMRIFVPSTTQE
ncbi:LOW QUALITY PROTEIN: proline-rich protein 3 [Sarcophilus harrisii]|uniref:LOW QUALITY PROTEIN: proline-rich protein 3 n=1 Tax=Sarcophilus harrisii TaxID=9305 RepID=UPI001301A879|nr:LOW QUALITY PROTEIN: proline-rich protein 3 [Sarcophilus harrisii]